MSRSFTTPGITVSGGKKQGKIAVKERQCRLEIWAIPLINAYLCYLHQMSQEAFGECVGRIFLEADVKSEFECMQSV